MKTERLEVHFTLFTPLLLTLHHLTSIKVQSMMKYMFCDLMSSL